MMDVDPLAKYMAMFVGPNGSGKSIAYSSWIKKGSVYIFDFDGRMASVANWYKQRGLKQGQLTYDTFGPDNLYEAFVKLDKFLDRCDHALIAVDSFTSFTVSAVMYSLRNRDKKGGVDAAKLSKGNMVIPDWDEWNAEAVAVTRFLDICKSLAAKKCAIVWTAHPVQSTKIVGKTYSVQTKYAAYGHKSESLVPIYFNEIYNFVTEWNPQTDKVERLCLTQPMAGVNAKTALNIPEKIEWTDKDFYQTFIQLVQEGQDAADERGRLFNELNPTENKPNPFD